MIEKIRGMISKEAKYDYVVSLDDDGQMPARKVPKQLCELEKGYDVVCVKYEEMHQKVFRHWGFDLCYRQNDSV